MASWEEIADEIVPAAEAARALATGARRGPTLPHAPEITDENGEELGNLLPVPTAPREVPFVPAAFDATLETALGGSARYLSGHGEYFSIQRQPSEYSELFSDLAMRLERLLENGRIYRLNGSTLPDLLFMDIETTGLSASGPLFLIGTLWFERGESASHITPRVEFFLARQPSEERAVLAAYHRLARGKHLITFNGKGFDWPYIEGRSRRAELQFEAPTNHLDALHLARRIWRGRVPNCRLQTLELFVCGRTRRDDVASANIPRTYAQWLQLRAQERGASLLVPVVHHNALDVLTMAELVCYAGEKRTWQNSVFEPTQPTQNAGVAARKRASRKA